VAGGNGTGNGHARVASGRGFGTTALRAALPERGVPPVASRRAYLRAGLPALFQDSGFGMRFVGALETLLDPVIALLDALPAHFDPDYAPPDVLRLLAAWMGVELDESQTLEDQREAVRRAAELGRRRGTLRGLQLALELAFPALPLRVQDSGGVLFAGAEDPPATSGPPQVVVYCDEPVDEDTQAAIARAIEHVKPVHVGYRLRVRTPRRADG
jgi:phage tail-like protein